MSITKNSQTNIIDNLVVDQILKSDELYSIMENSKIKSGPFDGGSLVLARGFHKIIKGDFVYLESKRNSLKIAEHYGLRLNNGAILDGEGYASNETEWKRRYIYEELVDYPLTTKRGIRPESIHIIDEEASQKIADLIIFYMEKRIINKQLIAS